jgi:hypothetical protein
VRLRLKRRQQTLDAGKHFGAGVVLGVEVFEQGDLGAWVEVGAEGAESVYCAAAVGGVDGEGGLHAPECCPAEPCAGVGARGADEDAVHVEEDSVDGEGDGH